MARQAHLKYGPASRDWSRGNLSAIRFNDRLTDGKAKTHVVLKRDHKVNLSESTVGRVLASLISQGKIKLSLSYARIKRRRKFDSYAKKWRYGMKAANPRELVQIDYMTVTKNSIL